jgi:hypothetical protein
MIRTSGAVLGSFLGMVLVASADEKGTKVTIDGLSSMAPAHWKVAETTSQMRFKQFSIPRVGDDKLDGELIVFFFGSGGGGGVQPNLTRWRGMFENAKDKVEGFRVGDVKCTYLDISGTYLYKPSPMAPRAEPRANHRMLAVVFESPKGPYFVRFVGPEKTITENKKGFDEWLKNFK